MRISSSWKALIGLLVWPAICLAQGAPAASCEDARGKLTPEQYRVACQNGTERPFDNAYWNNHEPGLYVDVVTGKPLFSSDDKFDSGTGWPSFSKPIEPGAVGQKTDADGQRVEVRSKDGNTHLGHVFDDGPAPTGQRYCVNSASLRFVPKKDLGKEGYEQYEKFVTKKGK